MPLPLLIGLAIGSALFGGGAALNASCKNDEARDINNDADDIMDKAKKGLNQSKSKCNRALQKLGLQKLNVLNGNVTRFVDTFGKLKAVKLEQSAGLDELQNVKFSKESLAKLREMSGLAASAVAGSAAAAFTGGALTAFGAYSATAALATASTGTAIAGLSGVAATNATLAWLGGGSLAAGGLGVAGGTAVLGGLVAGPALLVMGFMVNARANENLDNAHSRRAQARNIAEELETAGTMCEGIAARSDLFSSVLAKMDKQFGPLIDMMETVVSVRGTSWGKFRKTEKEAIAACASLAQAIKTVLDTPILSESGTLNPQSESIAKQTEQLLGKAKALNA